MSRYLMLDEREMRLILLLKTLMIIYFRDPELFALTVSDYFRTWFCLNKATIDGSKKIVILFKI